MNISHAFEYNTRSKIVKYLIYVTVDIVIIFKGYFILLYALILCSFDPNTINQCAMCDDICDDMCDDMCDDILHFK